MDRNQATGLFLIFAIIFTYFTFFAPSPEPPKPQKVSKKEQAQTAPSSAPSNTDTAGGWQASKTAYACHIIDNGLLKATICNGQVTGLELNKYKTYTKQPLLLLADSASRPQFIAYSKGKESHLAHVPLTLVGSTDSSVTFGARSAIGDSLSISYVLPKAGYVVKVSVQKLGGFDSLKIDFPQRLPLYERDFEQSRNTATITYLSAAGDFDKISETETAPQAEKLEGKYAWVTHKQKFFNVSLLAPAATPFTNVKLNTEVNPSDSTFIKYVHSQVTLPKAAIAANGIATFSLFAGPNNFKVLSKVAPDFEKNVELGWPLIRWINKYVVVNVFHFLESYTTNYGLIILLLVILIRIVLFPLSYKSYISMAKMKVLKPELDAIKEKHGDDAAAAQQDQMKLYNQVGINPMSGCIPLLLQMPVLLAMFNFFPNSIELRQESLWWATDLSTYDSIATLPFTIPSYGDHVSLFTILMTISTLAITWFNNQTSAVAGPMQSISYIMPVVFMFILNSLPAGLSFYYLVSNVASLIQQFAIKNSVNEESIRAKLVQNKEKNANKKPGKFASRLEAALRSAEDAKRAQAENSKRLKK